jgi:hypothetical protein
MAVTNTNPRPAIRQRRIGPTEPTGGQHRLPYGRRPLERSWVMAADRSGHRPLIEVLYVQDCPHYPGTLAMVERVRAELAIDAELRTGLVVDQAAADQARFPGSPTVRVDGRDVEPGSEPATRIHRGLSPLPARAPLRRPTRGALDTRGPAAGGRPQLSGHPPGREPRMGCRPGTGQYFSESLRPPEACGS